MLHRAGSLFQVIHSTEFDADLERTFPEKTGDEVWRAASWAIARGADRKEAVRGIYYYPIYPGDGFCYLFFYSVAGEVATMLRIKKASTPVAPSLLDDIEG